MKMEMIYALPAAFCEELKAKSQELTPGLYLLPPEQEWQPEAENVLFAQRREMLEVDNSARQINGYLIPRAWDEQRQEWVYFPYMRVEGSGEADLINKVSCGYGGHVDLIDGVDREADPSVVSIKKMMVANLQREGNEEFTVVHFGNQQIHGQGQQASVIITEIGQRAIIITNGRVEDRHIGLVTVAEVPFGQQVIAKEKGLVALQPMTASELLDMEGVVIEDWTRIFMANLQPQDKERGGNKPQGHVVVSYFGGWANEVAFARDFFLKNDKAFELYEGEDAMDAINRILEEHQTNGFVINTMYGRKLLSVCGQCLTVNIGRPLFELLLRPDEAAAVIDLPETGAVETVAPASMTLLREILQVPDTHEGGIVTIQKRDLENDLYNLASGLLNSEHKLKFLRILAITHETEMTRHRQAQERSRYANPNLTRSVPAGQVPQGVPRDLMSRLAAEGAQL